MGKVNTARGDCAGNCVNMNWRNIGRKIICVGWKKRSGRHKLWFKSRRTCRVPARGRKRKADWTCLNFLSISYCCNPGDLFHFWSMILNSEESWLFVRGFSDHIEFVLCGHLLESLPWIDFCPGFYVFIASANMMEFLGVLLFFISQLIQLQLWPEAELTSLKGWRLYELYPRRGYNGTQIMIGFWGHGTSGSRGGPRGPGPPRPQVLRPQNWAF